MSTTVTVILMNAKGITMTDLVHGIEIETETVGSEIESAIGVGIDQDHDLVEETVNGSGKQKDDPSDLRTHFMNEYLIVIGSVKGQDDIVVVPHLGVAVLG